ncbi:tail fiber protein [Paenibacillus sp. KACC 21273]|uniref:phage tail protein n=1 Tax=Paenibacillus sp. KACC 21273 TaxID=3025665 RepID=UPI0023669987|nr:tail fiber protein [Paenibacillus sp. KACC 21273]WDF50048.1 tail fiber protein [Paenibacillus sp. KACC 21273]
MAEPFVGEIRIFAFGTIPNGWAPCNGQKLPIRNNQALFSIITTLYGGDGVNDFALPNLQGRVPVNPGTGITLGQSSGEAAHALTANEMPNHNHTLKANKTSSNSKVAAGNFAAVTGTVNSYATGINPNQLLSPSAVSKSGGDLVHNNMQPYLTFNFCIALTGIYPSRP